MLRRSWCYLSLLKFCYQVLTRVFLGDLHCSILRKPATTTYMMSFSVLITVVWIVMIMCNLFTTCIKTEVKKVSTYDVFVNFYNTKLLSFLCLVVTI